MVQINVEHAIIILICVFLLYHFMRRCGKEGIVLDTRGRRIPNTIGRAMPFVNCMGDSERKLQQNLITADQYMEYAQGCYAEGNRGDDVVEPITNAPGFISGQTGPPETMPGFLPGVPTPEGRAMPFVNCMGDSERKLRQGLITADQYMEYAQACYAAGSGP